MLSRRWMSYHADSASPLGVASVGRGRHHHRLPLPLLHHHQNLNLPPKTRTRRERRVTKEKVERLRICRTIGKSKKLGKPHEIPAKFQLVMQTQSMYFKRRKEPSRRLRPTMWGVCANPPSPLAHPGEERQKPLGPRSVSHTCLCHLAAPSLVRFPFEGRGWSGTRTTRILSMVTGLCTRCTPPLSRLLRKGPGSSSASLGPGRRAARLRGSKLQVALVEDPRSRPSCWVAHRIDKSYVIWNNSYVGLNLLTRQVGSFGSRLMIPSLYDALPTYMKQ